MSIRYQWTKRVLDFSLSLVLILFFLPLMVGICLWILSEDGNPIFFAQLRPGKNQKLFRIYKFRSLETDGGARPTRIGAFLRNTKLDELPQLLNVVLGQMSLVGPRPCTLRDHAKDNSKDRARYFVKPGMTGLWQSHRSKDITFSAKSRLDAWYAKHACLSLDFYILFKTIPVLLQGEERYRKRAKQKRTLIRARSKRETLNQAYASL